MLGDLKHFYVNQPIPAREGIKDLSIIGTNGWLWPVAVPLCRSAGDGPRGGGCGPWNES